MSGQLRLVLSESQTGHNSFRVEQADISPIPNRKKANSLIKLNSGDSSDLRGPVILSTLTAGGSWLNSLIISKTCTAVSRYNLLNVSGNAAGVCRETKHEQYSGSAEHNHYLDSGKEKGTAANGAIWDGCFLNHEENQHSPVLDDGRKPNLAYEENQFLAEQQDN